LSRNKLYSSVCQIGSACAWENKVGGLGFGKKRGKALQTKRHKNNSNVNSSLAVSIVLNYDFKVDKVVDG
jgi:hypothetical protein